MKGRRSVPSGRKSRLVFRFVEKDRLGNRTFGNRRRFHMWIRKRLVFSPCGFASRSSIVLSTIFCRVLNHKEMELPQSKLLLLFFLINVSFWPLLRSKTLANRAKKVLIWSELD